MEDQAWEELSTDSSDCDVCTDYEYGHWRNDEERSGEWCAGESSGKHGAASVNERRPKVFEWDRRPNRYGGCIDDVSRGLENVRIQVSLAPGASLI